MLRCIVVPFWLPCLSWRRWRDVIMGGCHTGPHSCLCAYLCTALLHCRWHQLMVRFVPGPLPHLAGRSRAPSQSFVRFAHWWTSPAPEARPRWLWREPPRQHCMPRLRLPPRAWPVLLRGLAVAPVLTQRMCRQRLALPAALWPQAGVTVRRCCSVFATRFIEQGCESGGLGCRVFPLNSILHPPTHPLQASTVCIFLHGDAVASKEYSKHVQVYGGARQGI
jgi:hypothetical protein